MPSMSKSEYARHRRDLGLPGGSAPSVTYAIRDGRITVARDGKIDSELADQQWAKNTSPAASQSGVKAGAARAAQIRQQAGTSQASASTQLGQAFDAAPPAPSKLDFAQSRSAKEYYEAELARLKFEEKQATLIPARIVKKVLYEAGRVVRSGHEEIVAQLAPDLAAETKIPLIERILKKALDTLDNAFADRIVELGQTMGQSEEELDEAA